MEAYEYDPPPSTQCGNHTPRCGAEHSGNLADKVFMNSKLNQGLLNSKSISTCPQCRVSEWLPAAHCTWCNIVARTLCLLKAVEQRVHSFWEGATSRDCSAGRQMSILTEHLFKLAGRAGCLPRRSPFFLPFIPDGSGFPSGLASHSWVAATPRKWKRLVKYVPVGYLKTYACKNKDPGKSGSFILLEMESSRYLSNHFHLLWLFSCQVVSSSLPPCKLQHARFLHPSLSPRVCSDSRPLSQWCYITISYCPLLLPSIFASIRVFSNESALRIRWPKYRSFSFCISPSSEHSGLISFRMGWFELLAVQGKTLKSLLQHNLYCVHTTLVYLLLCLCSG